MKTKSFAIALMGLAVVLAMAVCTPLAGCSGCSVDRGSAAIEKSVDSKSTKKKEAGQTKSQKAKVSAASASAKADQESASDATDTKADSDESKTQRPSRQGQAKPAPTSLRSPTATDRNPQSLRRNGCPSRAIGKRITAKHGYLTSSTRATRAAFATPAEPPSIRNLVSTPIATVCGLKDKTTAALLTTPTPPRRTKATASSKLRDNIGSWTSWGIGSNPPPLPIRRIGDCKGKTDTAQHQGHGCKHARNVISNSKTKAVFR